MTKQILLGVLLMIFTNSLFSQSDDKANILAVERSMAAALSKRDVVTLNNLFADDVTAINSTGDIINKQQILKSTQIINGVTLSEMQVNIKVNIAIVTGTEVVTGVDNAPYTNKLRFTNVLERKNGAWMIIASQQTPIPQ